jgi:iron complex outermembrane receptor protein
VFAARVHDWIVWRPTWFRYWEAENLANVFSRGFESQLRVELDWHRFLWTLNGNYAFTRSTNESAMSANDLSRGGQLVYIPVHTSNMHINVARQGYYIGASLAYTGRRYTQPSNELSDFRIDLNPYLLSDIYLGKDFSLGRNDMGVRLAIYNLLNVSYQAVLSRPMPLRNYSLAIRWTI